MVAPIHGFSGLIALGALASAFACRPPAGGERGAPHGAVDPSAPRSAAEPPAPPEMADPAAAGPRPSPAPPAPAPSATPANASACPADMVDLGRLCIDRYEAPNEEGKKPLLMQSALDGNAWCKERGKRLCRENEWVRACNGKKGWNYPYGASYQKSRCNDDKTWLPPRWKALRSWPSDAAKSEATRLDQVEPSGSRPECKTPEGVFDLTGNAAEWVLRTEKNETNYDYVLKGCYWARCFRPPYLPACDYVNYQHQGAERSYEMGFRCCRDRAAP
jgi:hypothetical protein